MATEAPAEAAEKHFGLSKDDLIRAYRIIYTSRRIDDREIQLKRQNRVFFQISGAGHEAAGAAVAFNMRPGVDWLFGYYRDRALCLGLGVTPYEMFLGAVGAADDPASGGRQMPSHWASRKLNIFTMSSPTATECLQGIGAAEAGLYLARPGARDLPGRARARTTRSSSSRSATARRRRGVLGGAQLGLHAEAPRRLRRRGQRLRHLGPGRGEHAGGLDLEAGPELPEPLRRRDRRLRLPRVVRRPPLGLRLRPGAERARPRPCPRHPPLLALPFGRRAALQAESERKKEAGRDPVETFARFLVAEGSSPRRSSPR